MNKKDEKHPLEKIMKEANEKIDGYFNKHIETEKKMKILLILLQQ